MKDATIEVVSKYDVIVLAGGISLKVFDKVQEIRQQRHRRTVTGKSNMACSLRFTRTMPAAS